ncbi:transposase [Salinisphaera sp. SWV1]|uniref:transposase n=1 Tax=Salinisphaera sp. SWV1 TaxID=3454139 RepID=UPI003F843D0A
MDGTLTVSDSHTGRSGVAPERLIRALLLQVLYAIRSEHQLVEQARYNMLFRWFVRLSLDDAVWDATTFTKNRQRLIDGAVTGRLLDAVVDQARHRVETPFGWGQYARPLKQTIRHGLGRVAAQAKRVFASYNLIRMAAFEAAWTRSLAELCPKGGI